MRQAINNLQSTHSGFGFVNSANVFKVCDQPHPTIVQEIIRACQKGNINDAMDRLTYLWNQGYSAVDIVVTVFRVVKVFDELVTMPCLAMSRTHMEQTSGVHEIGVHQGPFMKVYPRPAVF